MVHVSCTVLLKSANLAKVSYLLRCFFFYFCHPVENIYLLFWLPKVKGQEAFPPCYFIHMQNHVLWSDEDMQFHRPSAQFRRMEEEMKMHLVSFIVPQTAHSATC